jgi:hypothetical protein
MVPSRQNQHTHVEQKPLEVFMIAAQLNEKAMLLLRQRGRAKDALSALQDALELVTRVDSTAYASLGKDDQLISVCFTSSEPVQNVELSHHSILVSIAVEPSATSRPSDVCFEIPLRSRTVHGTLSAILLYHVALAYHEVAIEGRCQRNVSQSLALFNMSKKIVSELLRESSKGVYKVRVVACLHNLDRIIDRKISQIHRSTYSAARAA